MKKSQVLICHLIAEFNILPLNTFSLSTILSKKRKGSEIEVDEIKAQFKQRGRELRQLLEKYKPEYVFIDEFCSTDILHLKKHFNTLNIIVLSTFIPSFPNQTIPPHNQFEFPGEHVAELWKKRSFPDGIKEENLSQSRKKAVIELLFSMQKLPDKYAIWNYNAIHPSFSNISKWYLIPEEFDFKKQELKPWERYVGPMLNLNTQVNLEPLHELFLKLAKRTESCVCIYVSMGTVIEQMLSQEVLLNFYNNLITIGAGHPDWFFFISIPSRLINIVKPLSLNVFIFPFCPQLAFMKKAHLFITHGGSSVYEAMFLKIPMLVFPPASNYDYNGHAARIVFHGLGEKASFEDSSDIIATRIQSILNTKQYSRNLDKFQKILRRKYQKNYPANLFTQLPPEI